MEDRVRRGEHAARQRPRSASARRGERAQADPRRNRELEAGCGLQSARAVSRRGRLRSERRELSRAAADALYRLQSARARARSLSRKFWIYHRIRLPAFSVSPRRRKIPPPPRLTFPLIVKSLNEDASWGISQASVVDSDDKLVERVSFIHDSIGTAAIA